MHFASDNTGPAHPAVLQALIDTNDGHAAPYGADEATAGAVAGLRALFEAPDAAVFFVATGTAANSLALATLCPPYRGVLCSPVAHIHRDEGGAPEFFSGGKLLLVPGDDRMTPQALETAIRAAASGGVHGVKAGAVSITSVTENGNVLPLAHLRALTEVAHAHGLPVHLDGARFANACVRLGCTPAEMSWRAGIDVAVFGGSKNGLPGAEAVLFFDPARAEGFAERRKRAGHLFSKHRYLAAQFGAAVRNDLWRDLAARANAACDRLRAGIEARGVTVVNPDHANMLFMALPRRRHAALMAAGAVYNVFAGMDGDPDLVVPGRLVCDWSTTAEAVDAFLAALDAVLDRAGPATAGSRP